jgi:hypothetical protein
LRTSDLPWPLKGLFVLLSVRAGFLLCVSSRRSSCSRSPDAFRRPRHPRAWCVRVPEPPPLAGPPCQVDSVARPPIGSEYIHTYFTHELFTTGGAKLFTVPSMLSDPKYDPKEFRTFNRANDQITVLLSQSEATLLIVEDRSNGEPITKAHLFLRRRPDSSWTWTAPNGT